MQNSVSARPHRTAAQRAQILTAYHRSDLTQKAFAAQAGIGCSTLASWLRKATACQSADQPAFVAVPNLLPAPGAATAYRLQFPRGLVVEVAPGFRPAELNALLQTEISLTLGEVEQEAERPAAEKSAPVPKAKIPRPNHPGRESLPAHLERREVILPCHPKDCRCEQCGAERPVIGYETREELACEPAKFYVKVVKREKRGSHCLPEQGVVTAPAPAQIVPKGKLSDEFIIEVLAQKYQQHLPIYRQQAVRADHHGITLSRKTLTDAVLAAGGLLQAVVGAQKRELLAGGYVQADETPVPCQTGEQTGRNHKAYLWEYSTPGGVVVFDFKMGRGHAGPKEFLQGFRGKLQSDGYDVYDNLGEGIVYADCLTHARRKFVDAARISLQ